MIWYEKIKAHFYAHADEKDAEAMKAYMKNHFEFLGIRSPLRKELSKSFFKKEGYPDHSVLFPLTEALWHDRHREMQYLALDLIGKNIRSLKDTDLDFFENLILEKSWWDTIDYIAPNICGKIFLNYPHQIQQRTQQWNQSDNIWLQRSSILFQLKYRDKTDFGLLKKYILHRRQSKEFFVQKAAGWALRQYSKYNPIVVRDFIQTHQNELAPLTIKEGSKYIFE